MQPTYKETMSTLALAARLFAIVAIATVSCKESFQVVVSFDVVCMTDLDADRWTQMSAALQLTSCYPAT